MSQAALQVLVGTALTDPEFCAELLNGKRHTLLLAFEFTDEERGFVQAVQAGSLQEFAARLDEWLQAQEGSRCSDCYRAAARLGAVHRVSYPAVKG